VSTIKFPEFEAVSPDGAAGGKGFTTIDPVAVLDAPLLSVTVRDAV
jgi:hypothetical protein